jgi:HK97 family phage prohead protease
MIETRYGYGQTAPRLQQRVGTDPPQQVIVGFASVYYDGTPGSEYALWEDVVERIAPGAFDKAVKDNADVVCTINHDSSLLLGRTRAGTLKLTLDPKGLRYECALPDSPNGWNAAVAIQRNDIVGSSFAFLPVRVEYIMQKGGPTIREIRECELVDVSCVTWPAYTAASVGIGERGRHGLPGPGGRELSRDAALANARVEELDEIEWKEIWRHRRARMADIITRARIVELEMNT